MADETFDSSKADQYRNKAMDRITKVRESLKNFEEKYDRMSFKSKADCIDCFADMREWLYENRQRIDDAMQDLRAY